MGQIITFYSYKGGVGRTMALANVAVLLSKWGYKVLVVDWDLEAPGLENFFKDHVDLKATQKERGVIDLLDNPSGNIAPSAELSNWQEFIVKVEVRGGNQPMHLLTAGKRDEQYFQKVRDFDVQAFYSEKEGGLFIESLRDEWKGEYDFVLIDSRTGVTDIGGICTIQLPDILVLIFTATEQSLDGILDIAKKAAQARQKLPVERYNLLCVPIPGRFDTNEEFKISQEWLDKFTSDLSDLYTDWLPEGVNKRDIIAVTKIPYSSYFSFGEKLAVLEQGTVDPTGLGHAFETLGALIANNLDNVDLLLDGRDEYIRLASQREAKAVKAVAESKDLTFLSEETLSAHRKWLASKGEEGKRVDLRSTKLNRINLTEAVLRKAIFIDTEFLGTHLNGADLSGADLSGADFLGADLSDADLSGANLTRAKLNRAKLARANLRNADIRYADLSGADFWNANLSGADLTEASLDNTNLRYADLSGANLTRANFSNADLGGAKLSQAILYGIDFTGAKLIYVNLAGAKLTFTRLAHTNLSHANLSGANLTRADLTGANLSQADLSGAILTRANLAQAVLARANLDRAILNGTNLTRVDLKGFGLDMIMSLTKEQIKSAIINDSTRWFLQWREELGANLSEWEESSYPKDLLLKDASLEKADYYLRMEGPHLSNPEQRYIRASIRHKHTRQLLQAAAIISLIAILFLLVFFWWRGWSYTPQQISTRLAAAAKSEATNDPALSARLALEAVKAAPTPQAVAALRSALNLINTKTVDAGEVIIEPLGTRFTDAAFTSDNTILFTWINDNRVRVWQSGTGANAAILLLDVYEVTNAAFSPDGKFIVTSSANGIARVWDINAGKAVAILQDNSGYLQAASFSPDGKFVVTASFHDGTARVWDISTGQSTIALKGNLGPLSGAAFSPDGKLVVTTGMAFMAQVWDASTGANMVELRGHEDSIYNAAFSPDGKLIVTASGDNTARVWDASTGASLAVLRGHTDSVTRATFSPDGLFILTGSSDKTARIWSSDTYEPVAILGENSEYVVNVKFNSTGSRLVTTCSDGSARLYSCEICGPAENLLNLASKLGVQPLTPDERKKYLNHAFNPTQSAIFRYVF